MREFELLGGFTLSAPCGLAIKVCGLIEPEHALAAAEAGADMIGLVFAPSRRQVTNERAARVVEALRSRDVRPLVAGVFVNASPEQIDAIAREVGLDVVQLSGDETPQQVAKCAHERPVIKAIRLPGGMRADEAEEILREYEACVAPERVRFLIDAHRPGEYGGTGQVADWLLSARLAERHNIMLAGGLHPGNVAAAVAQVRPWGIDVSSGVERDGTKDAGLIRDFIEAARRAATADSGRKDSGDGDE